MPHTSSLFVALPEDPEIASEAHVTLSYFGEAAGLSGEMVTELKMEIDKISARFAPFTADVSGTAVLGEDKASVLLLESFALVEIRDYLRESPTVMEAELNAEKRFPSWVPHLTTGYDDPVLEDLPTEIRFDSLGFWIAGEKRIYPLIGEQTAVSASAVCIPAIMCLEDLPLGLRYASAHADARWYVMKRAVALGASERIPSQWSRV